MTATGPQLRAACASEIASFCAYERDFLVLHQHHVRKASEPILEQMLADCMIEHRDELSAPCASALKAHEQADAETEERNRNRNRNQNQLEKPSDADPNPNPEIPAKTNTETTPQVVEAAAPALQMPVPMPSVQIMPKAEAPLSVAQAQEEGIEVRVFFINHNAVGGPGVAGSPYLRVGGEAAQYSGPHPSAGMSVTPWLGLLILPFFGLGLYVAITRAMTYFRRRRDVLYQVQSSSHGEYQSIPTSKLLPTTPMHRDRDRDASGSRKSVSLD